MNFSRLNPVGAAREHVRAREISSWGMVLVLALIVGALRWINSWDYPPFLLLSAAALIVGERAKEGRFTLRVVAIGVLKAAVMGVLSFAAVREHREELQPVVLQRRALRPDDGISRITSRHFGIMLFLMTGFVLFNLNRAITRTNWIRTIFFGSARRRAARRDTARDGRARRRGRARSSGPARSSAGVSRRLPASGSSPSSSAPRASCAARRPQRPCCSSSTRMLALGLGLCGGVEMFTLEGDVGRMNTVFKFYLHVWMMWGVVSAFAHVVPVRGHAAAGGVPQARRRHQHDAREGAAVCVRRRRGAAHRRWRSCTRTSERARASTTDSTRRRAAATTASPSSTRARRTSSHYEPPACAASTTWR